jgi:SAM-dependent methyltransferase
VDTIRDRLIQAYDRSVDQREAEPITGWKRQEREKFLVVMRSHQVKSMMDLGSGPGVHAAYFREQGLEVTCVDISPAMVRRCKQQGFDARCCSALELDQLERSFDAVFAFNSLLHIPSSQLEEALESIHQSLKPGGSFYWGQYGGDTWEGILEHDRYQPKRFFSFLSDDRIEQAARQCFQVQQFARVKLEGAEEYHFQSLILRGA